MCIVKEAKAFSKIVNLIQDVPKKHTNKRNKNGQTWQACQNYKVVQRDPKGSKMINIDVFDNVEPFWTYLDTFRHLQTKINLLPQKDKVGFGGGAFEQKIIFRLKWT